MARGRGVGECGTHLEPAKGNRRGCRSEYEVSSYNLARKEGGRASYQITKARMENWKVSAEEGKTLIYYFNR